MRKFVSAAVMLAAIWVSPAMAKEGLSIGGSYFYTNIYGNSQDQFDDSYFRSLRAGSGWGLRVGWGFNDYIAIETSLSRSYHETRLLNYTHFERQVLEGESLILKFNPDYLLYYFDIITRPQLLKNIEPSIFIGGGLYQIGDSGGTYYKGSGIEFGIGLDWYLISNVSVGAEFRERNLTFDKGELSSGRSADVVTITFAIGIAYHFL
jgi:opacity protein-like surface antigen